MSAQIEKGIVDANVLDFKYVAPDANQDFFRLGTRRSFDG